MTITWRRAAGVAGGVLLMVAGLASPTLAYAGPDVPTGPYRVFYPDNGKTTTWLFAPCGSDCTIATSNDGGTFVSGWEFHLNNNRWSYSGTAQAPCPNGAPAPVTVNYSFDAVSLAGDGQTTTTDACGGQPGKSFTRSFRLTKAG
jgi:hypothetical protein